MNNLHNTDPVTRLHRLYDMKLAQLEQATRTEGTTSLRCRVLAAEAEAINAALTRRNKTPVS